jgi:hypothetical protein
VQAGWLLDGQIWFDSYDFDAGYHKNISSELNAFDFGFLFGLVFQFDACLNAGFYIPVK